MFLDSALMICKGKNFKTWDQDKLAGKKMFRVFLCFIVCTTTHHAFSVHLEVLFNKVTTDVRKFLVLSLFTHVFTHATGC